VTIRKETIEDIARRFGKDPPKIDALPNSTKHSSDLFSIDDRELFRWLSPNIDSIDVLDVSPYEGANVIHDLNTPIPQNLAGKYDFIYDSSVLDNIFNPASGIINIYRMMSTNGRYVGLNVSSFYPGAFVSLPPEWFYGFFASNRCDDVKVYLTVQREEGVDRFEYLSDLYRYKPTYTPSVGFNHFRAVVQSSAVCHTIVIAEKAGGSTSLGPNNQDVSLPVNLQYIRSSGAFDWASLESRYCKSGRPLLQPLGGQPVREVIPSFHDTDHYVFLGYGF
jgi:hypothetical protein